MIISPYRLAAGAGMALVVAGAAVVAVAQTPPPAPSASTTTTTTTRDGRTVRTERMIIRQGDRDRDGMRGRGPGRGDRMVMIRRNGSPEDRAERLRTLLQLTPAQNGALQAYLTATAPPAPDALRQPARADNTPLTAVERADRAAEMTARMATEAKKRADAVRAFYAALTPSQRKVFDTTGGDRGARFMQIRNMRGGPPMPPMPPMPPRAPGQPG